MRARLRRLLDLDLMKRWKRILLAVIAVIALSQIPFAYRRFRLGKLSQQIASLDASKTAATPPGFKDLTGVLHVHTSLGGHTEASFEDLIRGAKGLDFVIITEHTSDLVDTAAKTLNGVYDG